jgi:hypothetical protein
MWLKVVVEELVTTNTLIIVDMVQHLRKNSESLPHELPAETAKVKMAGCGTGHKLLRRPGIIRIHILLDGS